MSIFERRSLGVCDLDAASRLHCAAFAPLGERGWTRQEMAELLASPGVSGLLLLSGERAVAMGLWRVAADEAELLTIAVDGSHRRQGAGGVLLEAVIEAAREARASELFLEVGADNRAACALYQQKAFKVVGRRKAYYERGAGPKAAALVMRVALTPGG
jgi:[ribosomal protein S18]-alanine N-acetyltransferase